MPYVSRYLSMVAASSLFFMGVAAFADTSSGLEAFRKGDYSTAYREWKAAAAEGKADAQYDLGVLFAKGLGVNKDMSEALRWYHLAADQGNAQAAFSLGQIYARGWGIPADDAAALRWIGMANGESEPSFSGWLSEEGYGMAQNEAEAAYWYEQAARKGHAEAQYNLARLYAQGKGVPKDDLRAARWLRAAATRGFVPAQQRLGVRFAQGSGVPQDNSQAYFWLTVAAHNGDKRAEKLRSELAAKFKPEEVTKLDESAATWQQSRNAIARK